MSLNQSSETHIYTSNQCLGLFTSLIKVKYHCSIHQTSICTSYPVKGRGVAEACPSCQWVGGQLHLGHITSVAYLFCCGRKPVYPEEPKQAHAHSTQKGPGLLAGRSSRCKAAVLPSFTMCKSVALPFVSELQRC